MKRTFSLIGIIVDQKKKGKQKKRLSGIMNLVENIVILLILPLMAYGHV